MPRFLINGNISAAWTITTYERSISFEIEADDKEHARDIAEDLYQKEFGEPEFDSGNLEYVSLESWDLNINNKGGIIQLKEKPYRCENTPDMFSASA